MRKICDFGACDHGFVCSETAIEPKGFPTGAKMEDLRAAHALLLAGSNLTPNHASVGGVEEVGRGGEFEGEPEGFFVA